MNWRRRFAVLAFRQAIRGPIPVSPSKRSPSGPFTLLKKGGPTVILVPCTASERIGKRVPQSTENAIPTRSRLLNRDADSRLTIDASSTSAPSSGHRVERRVKAQTPRAIREPRDHHPTGDWGEVCTLAVTPDRVRKVPKIVSRKVTMTRVRFHRFSIPRFSWIITEWRKAVIVSHGRKLAFSTGSQAQ